MPGIQYLDEALSLVQKCTTKQIKAVLRAKQDNEDVRLSAPRKEDLIQKNLRDALTSGAVPMTDVFRLTQDSEENGDQHISYWRIPPKLREMLEFEPVAMRLFGEKWKQTVSKFPSLTLKPESYVVSDFRSVAGKPLDWVLKIYGQASINEAVGKLQPGENGSLWQEYKVISLRSVLVVRRNGADLLEIRVQRDGSRWRVEKWYETVWTILQPVILQQQLPTWDLTKVIRNLILDCEDHAELYNFRDAGVYDSDADVLSSHEALSDQGNLMGSANVVESLKKAVAASHIIKKLSVNWLAEKSSLSEDQRTFVGARGLNTIMVQAHCSASDIAFLTDQLRRFMKS